MRRSDREAEGARLLSEYAPKGHLGFESLLLRQFSQFSVIFFLKVSRNGLEMGDSPSDPILCYPALDDRNPSHDKDDDDKRGHAKPHPIVQPAREAQPFALIGLSKEVLPSPTPF